MKTNEDKIVENLVDNIMKNSLIEHPSFDFTSKVMLSVFSIRRSDAFIYKPAISKTVFILIFGFFITLSSYLIVYGEHQTDSWFSLVNFGNDHSKYLASFFSNSKITIYSVVLATLMFFIQILVLKRYFEEQIHK